jgi:hypothetical protein
MKPVFVAGVAALVIITAAAAVAPTLIEDYDKPVFDPSDAAPARQIVPGGDLPIFDGTSR